MATVAQTEIALPDSAASAEETLRWALNTFGDRIAVASSFSKEDVAVIHMASRISPNVRVFALDTGRLGEDTYDCAEAVRQRYRLAIEWHFPNREGVERLVRDQGLFSFRDSLEARKACCGIRKVEPLSRALTGLQAWVTGMRREQSVTRNTIRKVEIDDLHGGIFKVNPLADWTAAQLDDYTARHNLPVNRLYAQGYASVGCAPCTRPIRPGEDARAGRWWWERTEHKECGLHTERLERHEVIC